MKNLIGRGIALLVLLAATLPAMSADGTRAKIVLTNVDNGVEDVAQFSCSDTVHGYIMLPAKAVGAHTIEGVWITPNNQETEHSFNRIDFGAPGRQTAYVWLAFQNQSDGMLGDVRAGGEGSSENLNGTWKLKVLWDGQPLVESNFKVKCS